MVAGALIGLVPMWASARPDVRTVLQDAGRGAAGASSHGRRLRTALVVGQVALAAVLAVQAGLLDAQLRGAAGRRSRVPGRPPADRCRWARRIACAGAEAAAGLLPASSSPASARLPGVVSRRRHDPDAARQHQRHGDDPGRRPSGRAVAAAAGGFRRRCTTTLPRCGSRSRAGASSPTPIARPARRSPSSTRRWPRGSSPATIRLGGASPSAPIPTTPWLTIVGVVGDVRHASLERAGPARALRSTTSASPPFAPFVAIRTAGDPAALATIGAPARPHLRSRRTLSDVRTMERGAQRVGGRTALHADPGRRLRAVALLLAALGVYGVVALVVAERTAELGPARRAGAAPRAVARLVVGDALQVTAIGPGRRSGRRRRHRPG